MARNYKLEYKNYQGSTIQKRKRAMRNKARRIMMKAGKVAKGDGNDVNHMDSNAMHTVKGNLNIQKRSKNRSFPRTKTAREKRGKK